MTKKNNVKQSFSKAGDSPSKTVAMLIDLPLGYYYEMDPTDQKAYLDTMSDTIRTLRNNHIDILWITMQDQNHLYAPQSNESAADPYSLDKMKKMGLMGFGEQAGKDAAKNDRRIKHEQHSEQFLRQSGPLQNETVFSKFFMSGFISPEEYKDDPERYTQLRDQFRKDIDVVFPQEGDSLDAYLKSQNATNLLLMGAFANHCIAENALDAHRHDYNVTVLSDRVVGWDEDNDRLMVWRNKNYEPVIQNKIAENIVEQGLEMDTPEISYQSFASFAAGLEHPPPSPQPGTPQNHTDFTKPA